MFAKVQHKTPNGKNWHCYIFVSTSIKFVGYEVSAEISFHIYPFLLSYHEVTLFFIIKIWICHCSLCYSASFISRRVFLDCVTLALRHTGKTWLLDWSKQNSTPLDTRAVLIFMIRVSSKVRGKIDGKIESF